MVEKCSAQRLFENPVHPYTKALLSAIPVADPHVTKAKKRITIKGEIPSPINPGECCQFADRCPQAQEACFTTKPAKHMKGSHTIYCHLCSYPVEVAAHSDDGGENHA